MVYFHYSVNGHFKSTEIVAAICKSSPFITINGLNVLNKLWLFSFVIDCFSGHFTSDAFNGGTFQCSRHTENAVDKLMAIGYAGVFNDGSK